MPSFSTIACAVAAGLATLSGVQAGFNPSSTFNVVTYWGQNSYGQGSGDLKQQRLSYYCANTNIDVGNPEISWDFSSNQWQVIPLAFLTMINGPGGQPEINFANAGDNCEFMFWRTTFSGTQLLNCPQIAADIATCQQQYGKTIMLSVGGATYTEGGFSSSSAAVAGANLLWSTFGPQQSGSSALRPFGSSSVDGFDFDFEAGVNNMAPFANQLRSLMNSATSSTGRKFYLSAAPQCPYPDYADNQMLAGAVSFDFINIQFYNNYCGTQSYVPGASDQWNFDFNTWDNWAKTVSLNKNVKLMLGVPAGPSAAGSGYQSASALQPVIKYSKTFSSFGGVMMWDASQAYANSGFLAGVKSDLAASKKREVPFAA